MNMNNISMNCRLFCPHTTARPTYCMMIRNTVTNTNKNIQIRVCTHRTCRKQGSLTTLETLLAIAPPVTVTVNSCGCLGRCGSGPNLVVLPQGTLVSHCGTPARAAEVLVHVCGGVGDGDVARRSLDCLAVRKRAEVEFDSGNLSDAEALFSQVIDAKPIGGIHIAYKGRSAVRLALGDFPGALDDANEAIFCAPQYAEAYVCQGDVYLAMNKVEAAENSYAMALEVDPSRRHSKQFQARIQRLQEKKSSETVP